MFIFPKIKHMVQNYGVLGGNLAQWVLLRDFHGGDKVVLNVYVPHTPQDCINIWQELVRLLPVGCCWMGCGD